jgi:hypothetical protein
MYCPTTYIHKALQPDYHKFLPKIPFSHLKIIIQYISHTITNKPSPRTNPTETTYPPSHPKMISLANLTTQIDRQHQMLDAHQVEQDALIVAQTPVALQPAHHVDLDVITTPAAQPHECKIHYEHECLSQKYGVQEGFLITLWAHLQFPDERVRQHSGNVKRFRRAKEVFGGGMGNGGSGLRSEIQA